MKLWLCILFVSGALMQGSALGQDSANSLKVELLQISTAGTIRVGLRNPSSSPIRLWKDSNSWGSGRWRVSIIRNGQLLLFFQNPNEDFTKNSPEFLELAPRMQIEQTLELNNGNWCGLGVCTEAGSRRSGPSRIRFEPKDVVVVSYDVPVTFEARKLGVWYGVTASLVTHQR